MTKTLIHETSPATPDTPRLLLVGFILHWDTTGASLEGTVHADR